ncbi:hypothetical protein BDB01DRAFT_724650 [Pilobolus umbonatus]|nr:hypothetical protein BDB01DRAFT_724650 [Pilobolus umbonatus]
MADYETVIKEILLQEEQCQFESFNANDALYLGLMLIDSAKPFSKPVAIDITLNEHQLFHYAMQGTSLDNEEWIRRKRNTVKRFNHSTYYMKNYLAKQSKSFEEKYYASEKEYSIHGGGFPLKIKNVGVVGTIVMSGLAQMEDHNLLADTIHQYIVGGQRSDHMMRKHQ